MRRFRIRPFADGARDGAFMAGGLLTAKMCGELPPAWQLFAVLVVLALLGGYLSGMASEQERRTE